MNVSEVNKILKDKKMQNKNTNFKIVDKKSGCRSRSSRKPTNRDLILQVIKRLDQLDLRINNLIKINNLKEK